MTGYLSSRVSVVLLTYNCAHRIELILERLLVLDVPVIAVDNGSSDGTAAVLVGYPQVETVSAGANLGAAGRNIGVAYVRTPYVAFCDDDGWYEPGSLERAVDVLDAHPRLALVNARILVGEEERLDPISAEMGASPLPDRDGIPGDVLLGFMAGAVVMRVAAFRSVGGYDPEFFMGGEEDTLAIKFARDGWQMRYRPDVVVVHRPSVANAPYLQAFGMRNALWNCWLHRRLSSAVRFTAFILADQPKNLVWLQGVQMAAAGLPWVLRRRSPVSLELDRDYRRLDRRRFRNRRPFWTLHDPLRDRRSRSDRRR